MGILQDHRDAPHAKGRSCIRITMTPFFALHAMNGKKVHAAIGIVITAQAVQRNLYKNPEF
ncbi:hypothetical protein [Cytobacillus sp. NCCP-133]|uniref:hypothetical protein n=1 Tax=Cytobacillus sp. NCCP-133 TaxID=766848 RepID=UPI00223272AA|nr:hypothetical protein [Cytobacillus sp. NCCP-133]GLB58494.1 hypothetical protein NCCP133_06270 [Cytobacillus sp. NCCP-133]